MAFVPKEWKDRLVEFAGRRKLTNVSTGEEMIVDVVRNEGTVSQEGDAFSAANMSDLEQRVADEFNNLSFPDGVGFYPDIQDGVRGYNTDAARGADTFVPFSVSYDNFDTYSLSYGNSVTLTHDGLAYVNFDFTGGGNPADLSCSVSLYYNDILLFNKTANSKYTFAYNYKDKIEIKSGDVIKVVTQNTAYTVTNTNIVLLY